MDEVSENRKKIINHNGKRFYDILKLNGFDLIGYTELVYFDNVFIFKTQQEADKAYQKLEIRENQLFGFWYGKEKFLKVKEHIDKKYVKLHVYWISE